VFAGTGETFVYGACAGLVFTMIVFLAGVAVATTLIWPPVFEYLAGH
jgi:hypothetical protein